MADLPRASARGVLRHHHGVRGRGRVLSTRRLPRLTLGSGILVGRILKGDKPADLSVEQVSEVELIVNLRAASALGLAFSLPMVGRANEVIE
jgi:hypothetical protein